MANERKSYNRGFIKKTADGKGYGALNLFISNAKENFTPVRKNTVDGKEGKVDVLNISTFGYFAGPSGIAYALGSECVKESGAVNVDVACWGKQCEFTEKLNLNPGDLITVYGEFTKKENNGFVSLAVNADKVELVKRKGEAAANAAPAPAPEAAPAAPAPAEDDIDEDIDWD